MTTEGPAWRTYAYVLIVPTILSSVLAPLGALAAISMWATACLVVAALLGVALLRGDV